MHLCFVASCRIQFDAQTSRLGHFISIYHHTFVHPVASILVGEGLVLRGQERRWLLGLDHGHLSSAPGGRWRRRRPGVHAQRVVRVVEGRGRGSRRLLRLTLARLALGLTGRLVDDHLAAGRAVGFVVLVVAPGASVSVAEAGLVVLGPHDLDYLVLDVVQGRDLRLAGQRHRGRGRGSAGIVEAPLIVVRRRLGWRHRLRVVRGLLLLLLFALVRLLRL